MGVELLGVANGVLYAHLFEANFRQLHLAYRNGLEWPELQIQLPLTLYRLRTLPTEWRSPRRIMSEAVVAPEPTTWLRLPHAQDLPELALEFQVLQPLVDFGLLEWTEGEDENDEAIDLYRVTPRMEEFLQFRFPKEL
jgi:hypothetical protein